MKCNFFSKHKVKAAYIVIRTLACIYFCVTIPFRMAFIPNITLDFLFLDLGASLLFVADSGLRLFWQIQDLIRLRKVLPIDEEQVLQLNQDTAKHHGNDFDNQLIVFRQQPLLVSFFSLVSALPLDYAFLMFGYSSNTIKYILLMRVFLLMTLPSRVNDIAEYLESCGLKNIGIQRAWKLFFAMAIAGHWCCCVFYIVARAGAFNGQVMTWPEDAGIYERSVIEGKVTIELIDNALTTYIKSLYWAYITMVSERDRILHVDFLVRILTILNSDYNWLWRYYALINSRDSLVHHKHVLWSGNHNLCNCKLANCCYQFRHGVRRVSAKNRNYSKVYEVQTFT